MLIRLASNLLGSAILIAMIAGGGTQAGLFSDSVVKAALIAASIFALLANRRAVLTPFLFLFPLAVLLIFVLQLVPLPIAFVRSYWDPAIREAWDAASSQANYGMLTTSVDGTLRMFSEAATAVVFFWACLNVDSADSPRLAQFCAVGWFVHLAAGLIQFATTNFATIATALPYPINAGLFANSNHFGMLMAIGIPATLFFFVKQRSFFFGPLLALIYLMLFAVASRSALAIALLLTLLSLVAAGGSAKQIGGFLALCLSAGALLYFSDTLTGFLFKYQDAPVARLEIASTTWKGITHNFTFGSGFGTFLQIYPIYESPWKISNEYVNRAHNDYFESVLEGGAPAAFLIAIYLAYVATLSFKLTRMHASNIRDVGAMALLAIVGILLQSAVDYPLRTWALMTTFVYANAILADAVMHHQQAKVARQSGGRRDAAEPNATQLTLMIPPTGRHDQSG